MLTIFFVVLIIGGLFAIPQPETRVIIVIRVQQVTTECQSLCGPLVHKDGRVRALDGPEGEPGRVIDIVT